MRIKHKPRNEYIIVTFSLIILCFVFLMESPLHPWIKGVSDIDSSVFKTVALMMENGYMPYRDTFDHKGPLIYIIQYIGDMLFPYTGVWIIQFIFMFCTFFYIYRISRINCGIWSSVVVFFTSTSMLFRYYDGGNYTEEYAMAMIAYSMYVFMDYIINNKVTAFRLYFCGVALGGVLMLRPNMISVWVVFCLAIAIIEAKDKRWKLLLKYVMIFMAGVLTILLPIVIWLSKNSSLISCFNDYILFNMQYTSQEGKEALAGLKWKAFFSFANTPVFLICLVMIFISIYMNRDTERKISSIYLCYMTVTLMMICMGGRSYGHYGMILIPLYAYPLSLFFKRFELLDNKAVSQMCIIITATWLLSTIALPDWFNSLSEAGEIYADRKEDNIDPVYNEIKAVIDKEFDPNEKISVYGNCDFIYVYCNRIHATRYSYTSPIGSILPSIRDEYFSELSRELPKCIVTAKYNGRIEDFLHTHGYDQIWEYQGDEKEYEDWRIFARF